MASKYTLLADFIRRAIESGEYAPGSFLPGERILCEKFQVSRVTARAALKLLCQENLLRPIVGSGHQVLRKNNRFASKKKTHLIGGIFPATLVRSDFVYVPSILASVISEYLGDDYNLVLANSKENLLRERELIERHLAAEVDGLIVMPSFSGGRWSNFEHDLGNYQLFCDLFDQGLPVVLCDRSPTELLNGARVLPGVYSDHDKTAEILVDTFAARGFSKIVLHTNRALRGGVLDWRGYCRAMEKYRLEPVCVDMNYPVGVVPSPDECDAEVVRMLENVDSDTVFITKFFMVPALEKHCPGHVFRGHRVLWGCSELKAGWGNLNLDPYPCAVRPISEIGIRAARKMLALLAGDPNAVSEEYLPPVIEY